MHIVINWCANTRGILQYSLMITCKSGTNLTLSIQMGNKNLLYLAKIAFFVQNKPGVLCSAPHHKYFYI